MTETDFDSAFLALTGNSPFPWQRALYERFAAGEIPRSCNLPTGLGKTSAIPIWLIALANHAPNVPRRLAYVVNRRTVVDQATEEVNRLRRRLLDPGRPAVLAQLAAALAGLAAEPAAGPLAVSTLRGQFADNGEWRTDPARPAVVVGTIDMIGSRLLFAGYGAGFKYRPLYAGFLGQDALLVHDEAHLSPAFQALLKAVAAEQGRERRGSADANSRALAVMALTATSREDDPPFGLTPDDLEHPVVRQRVTARKGVAFHPAGSGGGGVAAEVARLASAYKDSGEAVLVFLRTVKDVASVRAEVEKTGRPVLVLTGTVRGWERDRMAREDPVFARFAPEPRVTPAGGIVYLLCTSAGEVGVDMSADHLVCDLTPFDSMAQRLGRVNRRGGADRYARVDVVYEPEPDPKEAESAYERARRATLELLRGLPRCGWDDSRHDASPRALGDLPAGDCLAAFTPPPRVLPSADVLFDAWALTTVRDELPGRPPVAGWLHGVEEDEADTYVAWREEVEMLSGSGLTEKALAGLLDDYPLKPHELLRDRTDRVFKHLQSLAEGDPSLPVWLLSPADNLEVLSLGRLVGEYRDRLANQTVVLPPAAGGLASGGMLCGRPGRAEGVPYDVADELTDEEGRRFRERRTVSAADDTSPPDGMRLVAAVPLRPPGAEDENGETDGAPGGEEVRLFFARARFADDEGSATARGPEKLGDHLGRTEQVAAAIVRAVGLDGPPAKALTLAARWHDLGKRRPVWQRSVGNNDYPNTVLAKSGRRGPLLYLTDYRHEFGSLLDVGKEPEFRSQPEDTQDLILHLITAHHGRGRPHFPPEEAFDPEAADADCDRAAREVPRRYARLQRRYGRWGLAWLESLLRVADGYASAHPAGDGP
jgi:CRISPR-associated endonuclease/helicase Cas3